MGLAMSGSPGGHPPAQSLRFGGFTLDLVRRGLYKDGDRVRLTSRPLETLIFLVENRGDIVEKQRLIETVWGGVFVTDDVLVQAIGEIRRALNDDKDDPRFVQTVPRQGYRFVAEVEAEPSTTLAPPAPAVPDRRWRKSGAGWGLAAVAGLLLAATWWLGLRNGRPVSAPSRPPALTRLRQLTTLGTGALKPAFSPDGRRLLFVGERGGYRGGLDLFVMASEGGEPRPLTGGIQASGDLPVFTADGRAVVFSRYRTRSDGLHLRDLWSVPVEGGPPVLFMAEASGAGFSPDGRQVAFTRHLSGRNSLWVAQSDDLDRAAEVHTPGFVPRFSADGRWLAFTTSNPEGGVGELWVKATSVGEPRRLTESPQQMYGLAWMADSRALVFAAKLGGGFHLWKVGIDGGSPVPLTAGLGEYTAPAVSPDGRSLVFCHLRSVKDLLIAAGPSDAAPRALTQDDDLAWPRLSPDGKWLLAVSRREDPVGRLVLFDLVAGHRRPLGRGPARYPSWWDAERVVYLAPGSDQTEVRTVALASGVESVVTRLPKDAAWLAVQPGGRLLAAVVRTQQDRHAIVVSGPGGSAQRVLTEGGDYEGLRFTPDGSALAWSGAATPGEAAPRGVFVHQLGEGEPRRVAESGRLPVPREDGLLLWLEPRAGESAAVVALDPGSGHRSLMANWSRVADYDARAGQLVWVQDRSFAQVYAMEVPTER